MNTIARRILHEPLLHFTVLGAVILIFARHRADEPVPDANPHHIVVTADEIRRIADRHARQYGSPPTSEQLRLLTGQHVRDEILYREGLALGLDQGDEIIRRRVVQKMDFLSTDLAIAQEPTEMQVQEYYREHREQYTLPARRSFTHIYFSPDRGGDAPAKARAFKALTKVSAQNVARAPQSGDLFPGSYDHAALDRVEAARLFGESQLADALFNAPVGQWSGPFRSGYGWHLILVVAHEPATLRPFAEIRDQVRADCLAQSRRQANAEAFAELQRKYTIVRADEQQ